MRIRILSYSSFLLAGNAAVAFAQEHGAEVAEPSRGVMDIGANLMFYTLIIFVATYFILKKYAFPKFFDAIEAREKALEDLIEGAKRDREAAAVLLAQHTAQLDAGRAEAQKFMSDARGLSEKVRTDMIEAARKEQADMLERAKRDIESEKEKAIVLLRREAVDLAILGASKVIEENLDNDKNRKLVESYLSSISTSAVKS